MLGPSVVLDVRIGQAHAEGDGDGAAHDAAQEVRRQSEQDAEVGWLRIIARLRCVPRNDHRAQVQQDVADQQQDGDPRSPSLLLRRSSASLQLVSIPPGYAGYTGSSRSVSLAVPRPLGDGRLSGLFDPDTPGPMKLQQRAALVLVSYTFGGAME